MEALKAFNKDFAHSICFPFSTFSWLATLKKDHYAEILHGGRPVRNLGSVGSQIMKTSLSFTRITTQTARKPEPPALAELPPLDRFNQRLPPRWRLIRLQNRHHGTAKRINQINMHWDVVAELQVSFQSSFQARKLFDFNWQHCHAVRTGVHLLEGAINFKIILANKLTCLQSYHFAQECVTRIIEMLGFDLKCLQFAFSAPHFSVDSTKKLLEISGFLRLEHLFLENLSQTLVAQMILDALESIVCCWGS